MLITGDIGHHEGLDAIDEGVAIIDAGHYGLEHIFIGQMEKYLQKHCKGLEIITAKECSPFTVI